MVNQINLTQASYTATQATSKTKTNGKETTTTTLTQSIEEAKLSAVVYEPVKKEESNKDLTNYTVDMDKIKAMKEETDLRMLELFKDTAKNTGLKQLGGVRGILEKLRAGEKVTLEIEYTAEDVEQAKIDVAEGGYWSAEETSNRLIDFAKALSGGDPAKAAMLKDSFDKAFKEIEEMFGGTLPDLSYNTYDLTMKKFDAWESGTESSNELDTIE